MFGGQVAIIGHINVGNNIKAGGQSGIIKAVNDGEILQGSPAIPYRDFWKAYAVFAKLPELRQQLIQLEHEVKNINKKD